jgi:hypothetical protein
MNSFAHAGGGVIRPAGGMGRLGVEADQATAIVDQRRLDVGAAKVDTRIERQRRFGNWQKP